MHSLKKKRID